MLKFIFKTSRNSTHTVTATLPKTWADVPQSLIPSLVAQVSLPQSTTTYREVLRLLLGIKPDVYQAFLQYNFSVDTPKEDIAHNSLLLTDLIGQVFWLWSSPLTAAPYKYIETTKGKRLLLEADLRAYSWGELLDCLIHYELFTSQAIAGNKHLDILVASFCRPERPMKERFAADYNGDLRTAYNPYLAEEDAKIVANIPEEIKLNVLLYFAGVTAQLFRMYDLGAGSSGSTEDYPGQSLTKNTFNLAEKGVFGNYDQTRSKSAHEILVFLEEHRKDQEAQQEHINSLRK